MILPTITGEYQSGNYILVDGDFIYEVKGLHKGGIVECRRELGLHKQRQGAQLSDIIEHVCIKPDRDYNPSDKKWTVYHLINNIDPEKL